MFLSAPQRQHDQPRTHQPRHRAIRAPFALALARARTQNNIATHTGVDFVFMVKDTELRAADSTAHLAQCSHVCCHTRQHPAIDHPRYGNAIITLRGVADMDRRGPATSSTVQTCETRVGPVQRGGDIAQRGLLGFGKMKDFDLDLNSEPFADIPDDEVAGDLEMLVREMGQRAATPRRPRRCPEGTDGASAHLCTWTMCVRCVRGIVVLWRLCVAVCWVWWR